MLMIHLPVNRYGTGIRVQNLAQGDVVHFVHVDGNVHVHESAAGTVLANFMVQGTLNVSGSTLPAVDRMYGWHPSSTCMF